jgi:hypothetical protein
MHLSVICVEVGNRKVHTNITELPVAETDGISSPFAALHTFKRNQPQLHRPSANPSFMEAVNLANLWTSPLQNLARAACC